MLAFRSLAVGNGVSVCAFNYSSRFGGTRKLDNRGDGRREGGGSGLGVRTRDGCKGVRGWG